MAPPSSGCRHSTHQRFFHALLVSPRFQSSPWCKGVLSVTDPKSFMNHDFLEAPREVEEVADLLAVDVGGGDRDELRLDVRDAGVPAGGGFDVMGRLGPVGPRSRRSWDPGVVGVVLAVVCGFCACVWCGCVCACVWWVGEGREEWRGERRTYLSAFWHDYHERERC